MNARTAVAVLIVAISTALLAGCNSAQPSSRIYNSDMDAAWAAALRVVEATTGSRPDIADREAARIETVTVTESAQPSSTAKCWRAIITLAPVASGTKITIRIRKAASDPSGHAAAIMQDTHRLSEFLNDVEEELRASQTPQTTSPPAQTCPFTG